MTGDTILRNKTVVVKDGLILELKDAPLYNPPMGSKIIDGTDQYLIPGLVDMHVHINNVRDLELFIAHGVTTVQNMWGYEGIFNLLGFANQLGFKNQINEGVRTSPTIYTAGPVMESSPKNHPFMMELKGLQKAKKIVGEQIEQSYDFIKVYDHLSEDIYTAIIDECRKPQVPVKGHVPSQVGLGKAIRSRQRQIDHGTGFLDYDAVKLIIPESELPEYAKFCRENGVYNCPTIVFSQKSRSWPAPILETPLSSLVMLCMKNWSCWLKLTCRHTKP